MIDASGYRQYQESPYVADAATALPKYNAQTKNLERKLQKTIITRNISPIQTQNQNSNAANDSAQKTQISKLLSTLVGINIDASVVAIKKVGEFAIQTQYGNNMLSFEFNSSKNTISDLQIKNSLVQMNFSDIILVNQLRGILLKMPTYEAEIKKISQNSGVITVAMIQIVKKQMQINGKNYPLP